MALRDKIKITALEYLTDETHADVTILEKSCADYDHTALKLELDYKLACAKGAIFESTDKNEFFARFGDRLVGYIGICSFGGSTMEVSGMVEPDFRRHGLFTMLYEQVKEEWLKRSKLPMLLLADRNATGGTAFAKKMGGVHEHSEFEMKVFPFVNPQNLLNPSNSDIVLRKATNEDAQEIANQNAIYFGCALENVPVVMPEEEEERGLTLYLAEVGDTIIGKVNLQRGDGMGAIFGLGILPEFRGRGLGRELLMKAIDIFKSEKVESIMLQVEALNDTALNLYKSCGFEITSTMDYYEIKKN